jgi:hypothetical protein
LATAAEGSAAADVEGKVGGGAFTIADFVRCENWLRGNFFNFTGSFQLSVSSDVFLRVVSAMNTALMQW